MKMRRVAALLLAGVMAFAFTACDSDEPEEKSKRERRRDDDDDDEKEERKSKKDEVIDDDPIDDPDDGEWHIVEWGDDDPDDDCIPAYSNTYSIDPDDPCADLYHVWQDEDNEVFIVNLEFFPNGTWQRSSDGGLSEGGKFVISDWGYVSLYDYDNELQQDLIIDEEGKLVDEYGDHYAVCSEIDDEVLNRVMNEDAGESDPYFLPLENYYGYWEYEDIEDVFIVYPDGTWDYTNGSELMSGTYEFYGNNSRTTLLLHGEDLGEDECEMYLEMDGDKLVMYDEDGEMLKRTKKIIP